MSFRNTLLYSALAIGAGVAANHLGQTTEKPGVESKIESVVTGTTEGARQFLDGHTLPGETKMWNNPYPHYPGEEQDISNQLQPIFEG
jgi:hypothetical protein